MIEKCSCGYINKVDFYPIVSLSLDEEDNVLIDLKNLVCTNCGEEVFKNKMEKAKIISKCIVELLGKEN